MDQMLKCPLRNTAEASVVTTVRGKTLASISEELKDKLGKMEYCVPHGTVPQFKYSL